MHFFRRKDASATKAATPQMTADTIIKLRQQLELLEKREAHIEKKIEMQLMEAKKKSAAKDKRGAIFCLKRKKMYETEIQKLQGARMTLETQVMTLENTQVNVETFSALKAGAAQMKVIHGQMNVDAVDNIMEDIQEEMATAEEIGRAISQPVGSEIFDEDELESELKEMEELEMETKLLATGSIPTTEKLVQPKKKVIESSSIRNTPITNNGTTNWPQVPSHAVESNINIVSESDDDELEALRKLEASMSL